MYIYIYNNRKMRQSFRQECQSLLPKTPSIESRHRLTGTIRVEGLSGFGLL